MDNHQLQILLDRGQQHLDQANHCFGLVKMAIRGEDVSMEAVEIKSLDEHIEEVAEPYEFEEYAERIAREIAKKLGLPVDWMHGKPTYQESLDKFRDRNSLVETPKIFKDIPEMQGVPVTILDKKKPTPQGMTDQQIDDFRDDWNKKWAVGSRFVLRGSKLDFVIQAPAYRYDNNVVVQVYGGHHFDVSYLDPFEADDA